jgi:hypothetical protein
VALTHFDHAQATVEDLKAAFAQAKPKYYQSRQRFTIQPTADAPGSVPLTADSKPLSEYGVADGATLLFKDLGPQVWLHAWGPACQHMHIINACNA